MQQFLTLRSLSHLFTSGVLSQVQYTLSSKTTEFTCRRNYCRGWIRLVTQYSLVMAMK